uniref:Uncharacterized protein n=1 Tax=termite gut metagenome TaxID=433724 RepID=S0DDA1_9ZZZZ
MEDYGSLIPITHSRTRIMAVLSDCNALSARYGLALKSADIQMLAEKQADALKSTGRVEFGRGPYEKLIYAFCDSPYLTQADYAGTLAELCALFYRFKNEAGEKWSDDELVHLMKRFYDGECHGCLDLTGDRLWQSLHIFGGDEPEEEGNLFEEE